MTKRPSLRRTTRPRTARTTRVAPTRAPGAAVGATEFKARCLELIDHVCEARAEYVVTRHGTPVARLVPVGDAEPASAFGAMAGTVLRFQQPFDPVPAVWTLDLPDDLTGG